MQGKFFLFFTKAKMTSLNIERGTTRSGKRFAARNKPYYLSLKELYSHHSSLFASQPLLASEVLRIGDGRQGNLIQTTIRFRADATNISTVLRNIFWELLREHTENETDGFEVTTVFNAILTDPERKSFSVFYGQDYSYDNNSGAASQLKYSSLPVTVRTHLDVKNIPTTFNFDTLIQEGRFAFEKSNVVIEKIINVVYLIRRLIVLTPKTRTSKISNPIQVENINLENELESEVPPPQAFEGQKSFSD